MSALSYEVLTTEDGLLWGAYVYGHHDLGVVKSEPIFEMLVAHIQTACMVEEVDAREYLSCREPEHHWIYDRYEATETGDPDYPWAFCAAIMPGAIAITGWRFA